MGEKSNTNKIQKLYQTDLKSVGNAFVPVLRNMKKRNMKKRNMKKRANKRKKSKPKQAWKQPATGKQKKGIGNVKGNVKGNSQIMVLGKRVKSLENRLAS